MNCRNSYRHSTKCFPPHRNERPHGRLRLVVRLYFFHFKVREINAMLPPMTPGLQDITAHVNFTDIAECGIDAGLELLGYTSQAFFLLNCGITELMKDTSPENLRDYLPLSAQLQKLASPAEMGELFKAMALGKGMVDPLCGFAHGGLTRML